MKGKTLQRQYKNSLSDYKNWEQRSHSEDYLLFEENIGPSLGLDETCLSNGELYTILTNKEKRGKKGSVVAMVKGTKATEAIKILQKISSEKRKVVKEVSVDMAPGMNQIVEKCFTKATRVTDRFHVQQLANDAVQQLRIQHRWEAIEQANEEPEKEKVFKNGDTRRQLLARSRYLLFKSSSKWTVSQVERARLLFEEYPDIHRAYKLAQHLTYIYENTTEKGVAFTRLARWFNELENSGLKHFKTVMRTIKQHYIHILNYFDNRSTNAYAESFNAKIKEFRRSFRGVVDLKFFLFRLTNIYA